MKWKKRKRGRENSTHNLFMNMVDKVNRKNYANLIFDCSLQLRCIHGLSATTLIMLYSRHNSAGYFRVTDTNEHVFFFF